VYEIVRMLGYQAQRIKHFEWKMAQIERNDHIGTRLDCSSDNVMVIGIRQTQPMHQAFIAADYGFSGVSIHECTRPFELLS